jgi:hypothetical protein
LCWVFSAFPSFKTTQRLREVGLETLTTECGDMMKAASVDALTLQPSTSRNKNTKEEEYMRFMTEADL